MESQSPEVRMAALLVAALVERDRWRDVALRLAHDWRWDVETVSRGAWPEIQDRYKSVNDFEKLAAEKDDEASF